MEKHFGITYEFDVPTIHKCIEEQVNSGLPAYICAPDGNVINIVHRDEEYKRSSMAVCFQYAIAVGHRYLLNGYMVKDTDNIVAVISSLT